MSDTSAANGKVVVNRAMSLDGFIAGPGHSLPLGYVRPRRLARDDVDRLP